MAVTKALRGGADGLINPGYRPADGGPWSAITKHPRTKGGLYGYVPRTAECEACLWGLDERSLYKGWNGLPRARSGRKRLLWMDGFWIETQDLVDHILWLVGKAPALY